jgi:hypothetical protein
MSKHAGFKTSMVTIAAVALCLGTTASFAASATWTVKPGGAVTSSAGSTKLTDATTDGVITCTSSATSGKLKSGSGLAGQGLGTLSKVSFSKCTGEGFSITMTSGALPWSLNAVSYKSGVTDGTITGVHITGKNSDCSAVLDGTSGTADNGMVKFTYTNKTHKMAILATGGNLHIYDVSGCGGFINDGDSATFATSYTVKPAQTITSP